MAQDSTPSMVMYIGDGAQTRFEVPFDKGSFGEIKVAFVRRGLTDYTYNPDTYTVDGYLYAWNGGVYTKTEQPTSATPLYDKTGTATGDDWEEGMYREPKNDIFTQAVVEWTGDTLTASDVICITRETEADQPYTYQNNQKHIERALDNLARQIQELDKASQNSLKVDPAWMPIAEGGTNDSNKMDPITWLQTIVRSKGGTLRELRVNEGYIEYTADDPDASSKTWEVIAGVKTGNAGVISHFREYQQTVDDTTTRYLQYSVDGGSTWSTVSSTVAFANVLGQPTDNAALGAALEAKQDVISDLSDIRSGAAAGATAVQPGDLATVATSGAYSDLSGTPTIPTVNNATITFSQGGVTKGTITLNQSSDETITLDAGGGSGTDLPDQTGHSGEFLTTNGTSASWAATPTELPTQTGQGGKFLKTDGSSASWTGVAYSDVSGTPSLAAVATSGAYSDLTGTPSLATVATSGSYSDLSGTPSIPTVNDATITFTQGGVTKGTITTNQSSAATIALDAGGGSPKTVNAAVVGSLTINGTDVSGFSSANYLETYGNFGLATATTFEIVVVFTTPNSLSGSIDIMRGRYNSNNFLRIDVSDSKKIHVAVANSGVTQQLSGDTVLSENTKYYAKFVYDGTDYTISLSTDGANYTQEATHAASNTPASEITTYVLNKEQSGTIVASVLHMDEWYVKVNNSVIWRGAVGHDLIAFQIPTSSNNYTWYRKYADGWVEQGGIVTSTTDADVTVTYPVAFNDTNYTLVLGVITQNDNASGLQWSGAKTMSASGFTAHVTDTVRKNWHASGMAA